MNTTGYPAQPPADAPNDGLLGTSIGNRSDASSSTGSLHAKVANNKALIDTLTTKVDTVDGLLDAPTADVTTAATVAQTLGNKADAAQTTVGTTRSLMAYLKGALSVLVHSTYGLSAIKTLIDTVTGYVSTILARETVVTSTKTLTAQGGGEGKVIDLFTVTGTVEVAAIYGECIEATNSTTLGNLLLHLFPAGGSGVDITATGTNCAGIAVGDIIRAVTSKATATQHLKVAGAVVDNTAWSPTVLMKKTGVATTIQAKYTSDAATDVDIKWTIRYRPLSTDGAIAASA